MVFARKTVSRQDCELTMKKKNKLSYAMDDDIGRRRQSLFMLLIKYIIHQRPIQAVIFSEQGLRV